MKNRILSIALAAVLSAGIFSAPVQEYTGSSSVAYAASAVAAPTASRKSGTYPASGAFSLKLSTATKGAKIYYSTGGGYKLYTKALKISKNTTVKCYAEKNGEKSKTVKLSYKLTPKVNFSVEEGTYSEPVTVKLSSTASGVKFYYTLDGSKPTTKSAKYTTKGITISSTADLRVAAVKSGWSTKYYTRKFVIDDPSGSTVSLLDDYTKKYAYNTLNSTQKRVYAALFNAAANHEAATNLSSLRASVSDVEKAYWAFDYENPQFFWLANGCVYDYIGSTVTNVELTYSRTKSEAERLKPGFEAAAQEIIDKALAQDDLFDRVKVLHDAVIEKTVYTIRGSSYISEADGALVYGNALCEGYSKAFAYLCQAAGIECICVAGYAGEGHMWNMLKLDGRWYNMDVTWDDTDADEPGYTYFCIPTSEIESDHSFNNPFPVPAATATKYSYREMSGIPSYSDLNSAYNGILALVAENYSKGVKTTTAYVDGNFIHSLFNKVNDQAFGQALSDMGCFFFRWSTSTNNRYITVTLS
ncbi:MAG: chitobiase/beta-hexosaminidase C-terminal domain-containing protein [Oscillospiraceae bacterium]